MMRTLRPLLFSALLLVPGSALADKGPEISIRGSVVTMRSSTVDPDFGVRIAFEDGWGAGLGVGWAFSDLIEAEISVSHFSTRGEIDLAGAKALDLGKLKVTPLGLVVRVHPVRSGPVDPWIGVGGAWVFFGALSSDDLTAAGIGKVEVKDRAAPLFEAGIGFRVGGKTSIFADAVYLPLKPDSRGVSGTGSTQELDLSPLAVSAGVRFGF